MKSIEDLEKAVQADTVHTLGGATLADAQVMAAADAAKYAAMGSLFAGQDAMAAIEKEQREMLAASLGNVGTTFAEDALRDTLRAEMQRVQELVNPKAWVADANLHAVVSGALNASDLIGRYDSTLRELDRGAHFASTEAALEAMRTASEQEKGRKRDPFRSVRMVEAFGPPVPMDFKPKALPADPEMLRLHAQQLQVLQKLAAGIDAADKAGQEALHLSRRTLWIAIATLAATVIGVAATMWPQIFK